MRAAALGGGGRTFRAHARDGEALTEAAPPAVAGQRSSGLVREWARLASNSSVAPPNLPAARHALCSNRRVPFIHLLMNPPPLRISHIFSARSAAALAPAAAPDLRGTTLDPRKTGRPRVPSSERPPPRAKLSGSAAPGES